MLTLFLPRYDAIVPTAQLKNLETGLVKKKHTFFGHKRVLIKDGQQEDELKCGRGRHL